MSLQQLKEQNKLLRSKVDQFRQQKQMGPGLRTEIEKFMVESKKNIKEMNEKAISEQEKTNEKLHEVTQKY